jgi:TolB protein
MVFDVTTERVRQVSSEGRNEDPSWAPDGRHLIFASTRTGPRQLHVIDLETGKVRILATPGNAQLPAWSRRLDGAP